jgi:hypothetical protein
MKTISQVITCIASFLRYTTPDRIIVFAKAYHEMAPSNQHYTVLNNEIRLDRKRHQFERYALKTEVAKVFLTTVIDQELVDPKLKDYEK